MTRNLVLTAVLIGITLFMLPSIFSSNAGAPLNRLQQERGRHAPGRAFAGSLAPQSIARPAGVGNTYGVESTADDSDIMPGDGVCASSLGDCTLRAAIEEANATPVTDFIEFQILPGGVQTIAVSSPLPAITAPLVIDGQTQPGFSGTPIIQITRANAGVIGNGLTLNGTEILIRGLVINGFSGQGILIQSGGGHRIQNNYIGTDPTGTIAAGNGGDGIQIQGSSSNLIGDVTALVIPSSPRARSVFAPLVFNPNGNLISGNTGAGISMIGLGSTGNQVLGNFIGTNASGTAGLGNAGTGIFINGAPENTIGASLNGNLISANNIGIEIQGSDASGISVQGNFIGTDSEGAAGLGNTLFGVSISGASVNNIGSEFTPNTIAFNGNDGVAVLSGTQNTISGNTIFSNGGLGIDLGLSGVTPNDTCDADTGANDLQNFPLITSVSETLTVSGTFESEPLEDYTIELFANTACDPSGNGEGRQFLTSVSISTGMDCTATFSALVESFPLGTTSITATARDSIGNTSEFSPCFSVGGGGSSADLAITKTDSPDPVLTGSQVTYTILVTNNGPDAAVDVTVTDIIPPSTSSGYTFASVSASQGSCTSPPPGGAGTVTCSLGSINSGVTAMITLVVNVTATSGSTITNTTTVTSDTPDPNSNNNSATTTTAVASPGACTINCPANVTANTLATRCGALVSYPQPTPAGSCFPINCTPPSGSFFPSGTTVVTCTEISTGPSPATCNFVVTVVDNIAPNISCPESITTTTEQGQRSRVVTFPLPFVSDNCSIFSINCTPPSGASFPVGTTVVECAASDIANNVSRCSFTVTVTDTQPPTITCPANVVVQATAGQCNSIVGFPAPGISGSPAGTIVVCVPPPGSVFPAGTTPITCTATTPAGFMATCSFSVTVTGPPQAVLMLEGNKPELEFGPTIPVRKSKKNPPRSCDCSETFMIENTGCGVLGLDLTSIMRTGTDVDSGKITNPDDSSFYTVTIINPDGTERPARPDVCAGPCISINPGQKLTFRVVFKPIIPAAFSGKTTGLAASEVVPERITSKITFNQQGGGAPLVINMVGRVESSLRLIDPTNPRKPRRVIFERAGDEFIVTYAIFDSNLDVNRARFEFFDGGGASVGQPIEVDLAGPVTNKGLVRGQSFVVVQRFTGADDNSEVASVRVTVFDPETSDTATGTLSSSSRASSVRSQWRGTGAVLFPPRSKLSPRLQ